MHRTIKIKKYEIDKSELEREDELNDIKIFGAREHNLKNVDISIPRDQFVVITGLSGSGKSSLAFDTLYAEGQRRYVECMSSYAKQFLGMMKKPNVDKITGLSPAISIEQKSLGHNPRSTVGTVTEIYDYLRLLYAKIGKQYCTECDVTVEKKTVDQIVDEILSKFSGKKVQILSPLVRARKGHYRELFEQLLKAGFLRVRIDGEIQEMKSGMKLSRYKVHDIELVVDRLIIDNTTITRLTESLELALKRGNDTMILLAEAPDNEWDEIRYSTAYSCPSCGKAYDALAPNNFSFNSPYGACQHCNGLGELLDFNLDLVIPDKNLSINQGAIALLGKQREMWLWAQVEALAEKLDIDMDIPIKELDKEKFDILLFGPKGEDVKIKYEFGKTKKNSVFHKFIGVIPSYRHHYENTGSSYIRNKLDDFMSSVSCPECGGGRLKKDSLHVLVDNKNISEITALDVSDAHKYYASLRERMTDRELEIAYVIIKEIHTRLEFLRDVGLSYLSLNRAVKTLSGGESQRIRLASQIGSKLVGITYILDEPSIGLHQHDNNKLINSLKSLRDLGNSVIVVEHDKAMIEEADHFIDIGPGAGVHGGEIVLSSNIKELASKSEDDIIDSHTAHYINGSKEIAVPEKRRELNGKYLKLSGAQGNNLKNVELTIPLGVMICVTGMSGSGKSTLINDTLYPILSRKFHKSHAIPLKYDKIEGLEHIDKVIEIDQSPIGRTPRSNPATYTGLFTLIRDHFALLPESKVRGYKSGRFSFNVKGGRCEECQGAGIKKIEMNFLPEVYVECDVCDGKRYNKETLQVLYKEKTISDVLDMTVEEALEFFKDIPKIKRKLQTLYDVGLTYITLGQQAPTLSGGEAQRVKLASELSKPSTGKTLYLLDEPTTGLHFEDINILLKLMDKLVDKGNTAIIIEHNLDVVKYADWIIDLGPEGGKGGGEIIAEGTPEDICKVKKSYTGQYLKDELK